MTASTLEIASFAYAETTNVAVRWGTGLDARTLWSVLQGIEEAKRGEGTILTDDDLAVDDDDDE